MSHIRPKKAWHKVTVGDYVRIVVSFDFKNVSNWEKNWAAVHLEQVQNKRYLETDTFSQSTKLSTLRMGILWPLRGSNM